jgi:hypothetical protein
MAKWTAPPLGYSTPGAIRIEDPDHLGTGRVELTVDGRPAEGDRVTFPSGGAERRVNAQLRPAAKADAAGPTEAAAAQRWDLEGS